MFIWAWREEDEAEVATVDVVVMLVDDVALGEVVDAVVVAAVLVAVVATDGTITKVLCGTPGGGGGVVIVKVTGMVSGEPEALGSAIVAVAL